VVALAGWAGALAAGVPAAGCETPSASLDGGDLLGVFDRDAGARAAGSSSGRRAPAASGSGPPADAPPAPPRVRPSVAGSCVPTEGLPNRELRRTIGRPACREARILEWRDGEGSPRYGCVVAPRGVETRAPLPLLLFFHGPDDDPTAVDKRTGLRKLGSQFNLTGDPAHAGFIVLSVQGRAIFGGKRGSVFDTEHLASDNVDVAAVDHFYDELAGKGLVDKARVYAVGESTGGQMAATYAMLRADRVAAFAAYAPEPPRAGWSCPAAPPPGLVLYRACDTVVPCDAVERWLRSRDALAAETPWRRLGLVDEEEPNCTVRNRCSKKKGRANHARWPRQREPELLRFFAGHALAP
jgi:poly(3-hydroxybutyrate) depolymerase